MLSINVYLFGLGSKGIEPKIIDKFSPKIGTSITFVVAALVFNEKNEILMMQEAKSTCAGTWYLPAGRVESEETFEDAVKREVYQETGLDFEPTTLLKVESSHGTWYRFVYTGNIIGGQLKTVAKADQESLQACYTSDVTKLSLRSLDCLKLIELGHEYLKHKDEWHSPQLVIHRLVPNILLRTLIGIRNNERCCTINYLSKISLLICSLFHLLNVALPFNFRNSYFILLSDTLTPHIPLCEINPSRSVHASLKRFMQVRI